MPIVFRDGDLLKTNCDVICHQVNCQGVMGAGIALQIKKLYPNVYEEYREYCDKYRQFDILGTCLLVRTIDGKNVANLFAQYDYGRNGCHTNYTALKMAFNQLKKYSIDFGYRKIGIPFGIGCGLAGGDWNKVCSIIEEVFELTYLEVEIWKLER